MIHKAKSFFSLFSEPIKRYLFHFSAFAGLFAGTARCPVCGQTLCPAGTTGLGLLAALFAFITSRLNKKHRHDHKSIFWRKIDQRSKHKPASTLNDDRHPADQAA
ncbi:MAG: hypothetical protein WC799_04360 [Desulfobacteraceae bacterium]|jgi:hypothetical protein